jgi:hypothetical protein
VQEHNKFILLFRGRFRHGFIMPETI